MPPAAWPAPRHGRPAPAAASLRGAAAVAARRKRPPRWPPRWPPAQDRVVRSSFRGSRYIDGLLRGQWQVSDDHLVRVECLHAIGVVLEKLPRRDHEQGVAL